MVVGGCRALCVDVEEGADTLWQAELLQDGPSPHSDDHGGYITGQGRAALLLELRVTGRGDQSDWRYDRRRV